MRGGARTGGGGGDASEAAHRRAQRETEPDADWEAKTILLPSRVVVVVVAAASAVAVAAQVQLYSGAGVTSFHEAPLRLLLLPSNGRCALSQPFSLLHSNPFPVLGPRVLPSSSITQPCPFHFWFRFSVSFRFVLFLLGRLPWSISTCSTIHASLVNSLRKKPLSRSVPSLSFPVYFIPLQSSPGTAFSSIVVSGGTPDPTVCLVAGLSLLTRTFSFPPLLPPIPPLGLRSRFRGHSRYTS